MKTSGRKISYGGCITVYTSHIKVHPKILNNYMVVTYNYVIVYKFFIVFFTIKRVQFSQERYCYGEITLLIVNGSIYTFNFTFNK